MSKLELYYWGYAEGEPGQTIEVHSHDYWQINLGISGKCIFRTESGKLTVGAGDLLIFPPGIRHGLMYPEAYLCYSFKFKTDHQVKNTVQWIRSNDFTKGISDAIKTIMETTFPTKFFGTVEGAVVLKEDRYQILMEHFLAGVLATLFQQESKLSGQLSTVYETLAANRGRYISVSEAAAACGYSRNRFNDLIRQQTGLTAKDYLNKIRLETAQRYLRFTSLRISEIASEMGFSTQFHFSDFFKRMTGIAPLQYRKKAIREHSLAIPD